MYYIYCEILFSFDQNLSPVLQFLTAVFFTCWREHFLSDDQELTVRGDDQVGWFLQLINTSGWLAFHFFCQFLLHTIQKQQ